jgi:glycosyltransferase involved in cell wall biosynthesis
MKATAFTLEIPHWPSHHSIQAASVQMLKALGVSLRLIVGTRSLLDRQSAAPKGDLWIFPPGTCQTATFDWLQTQKKRPPGIFFLTGEASKIGYHLFHFRHLFRSDDQWVVSCAAEKRLIDSFFPGNNRTSVCHLPLAADFFKSNPSRTRSFFKLPADSELLLYAGRLSEQKNILSLVEILSRNPALHLVLCGEFDGVGWPHFPPAPTRHLPSVLTRVLQDKGLHKRISYLGFQSQENLFNLMKLSDYQISLSSHYGEDFGYSIAQGLCCGLPTLLSAWGGHLNWESWDGKGITYLPLGWDKNGIGRPLIPKRLKLPKLGPVGFRKTFENNTKEKMKELLQLNGVSTGPADFDVSEELTEFWSPSKKQSRTALFSSRNHPLFKKVIKAYSE